MDAEGAREAGEVGAPRDGAGPSEKQRKRARVTFAEKACIVEMKRQNEKATLDSIIADFRAMTGKQLSRSAVSSILRSGVRWSKAIAAGKGELMRKRKCRHPQLEKDLARHAAQVCSSTMQSQNCKVFKNCNGFMQ